MLITGVDGIDLEDGPGAGSVNRTTLEVSDLDQSRKLVTGVQEYL